jgi:hypothetical protein
LELSSHHIFDDTTRHKMPPKRGTERVAPTTTAPVTSQLRSRRKSHAQLGKESLAQAYLSDEDDEHDEAGHPEAVVAAPTQTTKQRQKKTSRRAPAQAQAPAPNTGNAGNIARQSSNNSAHSLKSTTPRASNDNPRSFRRFGYQENQLQHKKRYRKTKTAPRQREGSST